MEEETILSGYCRRLDAPRMVEAVIRQGKLLEADCDYPACPCLPACPIAQRLQELEHPRDGAAAALGSPS